MQRRQFHRLLTASVSAASFLSPVLVHAQAKTVLRAGDQKGGLRALLEAAGELKDLSYDIKWTEFPAAAPLAEALNADAVDFGPIGDAPLLFTLAAGSRVKAFAANRSDPYGTAILVTPQSTLKDASSLKGKSIATNRGSIGHYVTLKALEAVGLTADDVQIKFIPPADAKLALTQGAVDAWATWEPYTALAETSKHARVLVSGRGLSSGLSFWRPPNRPCKTSASCCKTSRPAWSVPRSGRTSARPSLAPHWPVSSASPKRPRACSLSAAPPAGCRLTRRWWPTSSAPQTST